MSESPGSAGGENAIEPEPEPIDSRSNVSGTCARCGRKVPGDRFQVCPACLISEDEPDAVIAQGTLKLGQELGHGGMGTVFRARHLRLGREVAVKFLPAELADSAEFRTRFAREAHALALLNHPNIVTIHDYGEEDGQGYIVMELCEGSTLAEQLPLAPDRAIGIVLQICEALSYAHQQGIVHRDVKPGNVLIDPNGKVKVTDFGLARMAGEGARGWTVTGPDRALGSLYYMAPEVLGGAPPSPQVDVYALGVLLYESMTGALPVGDFERLPGAVDHVVRRALSQLPEKRQTSVDEFASELRRARHHVAERRGELPPAEKQWFRAVALLYATASAILGWALLVSLTPRAVLPTELHPLSLVGSRVLEDGKLVSLARFEVWPTLGALAAFGLALTASGFLRRHFSQAGLDQPYPDLPLRESKWLLALGGVSVATYSWRHLGDGTTVLALYSSFFGAVIELVSLYILWSGLLEAKRRGRPLQREPGLFVGFALMLVPPVFELAAYVLPWLR
ncbi:MAG TPA: serine/threonine-protein kinase [Polyangiaceae bacterium]